MAKIKLIPDPTFKSKVAIPVPGAGAVEVEFTFKHRTRDELRQFAGKCDPDCEQFDPNMTDVEMVMGCACGWELADTFNEASVKQFAENYIGGPAAVFQTYVAEMAGARLKNSGRPLY